MNELMRILEDKQIKDVVSIDMRQKSALFDYFIIGTIESDKQAKAVIDEVEKMQIHVHHVESSEDGSWILIDCFDYIVHLFMENKRKEYDLESLWKNTKKLLT